MITEQDLGAMRIASWGVRSSWLFLLGMVALVAWRLGPPRRFWQSARAFFLTEDSPYNLAVLRVVVFSTLLAFKARSDFSLALYVDAPADLRIHLPGLGWVADPMLLGGPASLFLEGVFPGLCAMAVLGLFTRVSTTLATLSALYLLAIPQFYGKVVQCNHLVWLAAVLSLSPCADVWSLDALRRRSPRPARGVAYGLPLRIVWALLAVIFFFPGWAKLWFAGFAWIYTDNLERICHFYWDLTGHVPAWRFDRVPLLCRAGAAAVVAYELAFPLLIFSRPGRLFLAAGGVCFLGLVEWLLAPSFWHLSVCLVSLLDWSPRGEATVTQPDGAPPRGLLAVAAVLLFGNVLCGLAVIRSWPFTVYPPFAYLSADTRERLEVRLFRDGQERVLDSGGGPERLNPMRRYHLLQRITRTPEPAAREEAFARLCGWLLVDGPRLREGDRLRLYRAVVWTSPDRRRDGPLRQSLVVDIPARAVVGGNSPGR